MLRLLLYLIGMGATLYVAILYFAQGFLLLLAVEIFFLLADIVWLGSSYRHANARLTLQMSAADKGQEIPFELEICNTGRLPVGREKVVLCYRSADRRKQRKLKLKVFAGAKESLKFANCLTGFHCGSYYFDKAYLVLYDPLRLLGIRKTVRLHERLDIMPDIYPTGIIVSEATRHFMGESDIYDSIHGGSDPSEPFQIREFRAGDKLKDIHWKLSAKEDTWVVREKSNPAACAVILLIELPRRKQRGACDRDALLSLAAGISFALVENRCPHYASWYSRSEQEMVRVRVDDEESLYLFLMSIFAEAEGCEERNITEAYKEQYKGETFLTDICVTAELEVFIRGEKKYRCKKEQLEKNMGEMLLRV